MEIDTHKLGLSLTCTKIVSKEIDMHKLGLSLTCTKQ